VGLKEKKKKKKKKKKKITIHRLILVVAG